MIENKYITFETNDIIEAIEDLYKKRTGEIISIPFDDSNVKGLRHFKNITVKKSLSSPAASIESIPSVVSISYDEDKELILYDDVMESESIRPGNS
jgi:hypothetical protein